jgi:N-acyl-D-amino-acid deacylase
MIKTSFVFGVALLLIACARQPQYDIVMRNGRICDGTGAPCVPGGIAINGDTVAKVGDLADARGGPILMSTDRSLHRASST